MSLADCVALALAEQLGGCLVTTDHHEFDPLSAAGHSVVFLRYLEGKRQYLMSESRRSIFQDAHRVFKAIFH